MLRKWERRNDGVEYMRKMLNVENVGNGKERMVLYGSGSLGMVIREGVKEN